MRLLFVCFSLVIFSKCLAQSFLTHSEAQSAILLFQEKKYTAAIPLLYKTLELYPKDGMYNYYMGVSLTETNKDIEIAINHLNFAATKNAPTDVYFYLGKAYLLNYQFLESTEAFLKFKKLGGNRDLKNFEATKYFEASKTASEISQYPKHVKVISSKTISVDKVLEFYATEGGFYGSFNKRIANDKDEDQSFYILSNQSEMEFVYYSDKKSDKNLNRDIFRFQNNNNPNNKTEALPPIINTDEDEHYPYFDDKTQTLYFCSKAHNNMGGYDIFQSKYNAKTNQWSKPENVGFPINTPFNDYLFIPQGNNRYFLATDRACDSGMVTIHLIEIEKTDSLLPLTNNYELKNYASLKNQPVIENIIISETPEKKIPILKPFLTSDYESVISYALSLQSVSDSVQRIIHSNKVFIANSFNTNEKKSLGMENVRLLEVIKKIDAESEVYYKKAIQLEKNFLESTNAILPTETNSDIVEKSTKETPSAVIILNNFEISPKPSIIKLLDKTNPEEQGIIYRIQLGAFSQTMSNDFFKGLSPIVYEKNTDETILKYYAGIFTCYQNCFQSIAKVRANGFKDAYIVAYFNGEKISVKRAQEIEAYNKKISN